MRECNNCFWCESSGNGCIFQTLCNRSFNKTGKNKYHIYPYEARRLLGDILLDMNRAYNRNENITTIFRKNVIKENKEY